MHLNPNGGLVGPPPLGIPPSNKRILFVDDEPKVLEGLQRMLYPLRREWKMEFVGSGHEALKRLGETEFDVLVTDVRMPEMSGIELLAEVVERHPQVIRMVLSGTVDQDLTLRSAALAHQYLVKPCDAQALREKVDRAFSLRVMLDDPGLKQAISRLHSIPSIPAIYSRLVQALNAPEVSARDIGDIVEQDVGLTAKVLQLANSAFLGISRRITKPSDAVIYLGVDTVRALSLTASVFSGFSSRKLPGFAFEQLQDHSLKVAVMAREIAKGLGWTRSAIDDAFVGGLLHDAGKFVLAHNCSEPYGEALAIAKREAKPIREAELAVFGTTHAEVGGYLLWLWGLSDGITEAAALHHRLPTDPRVPPGPVAAVHVADALVNGRVQEDLDREYLSRTGLIGHLPGWQETANAQGW